MVLFEGEIEKGIAAIEKEMKRLVEMDLRFERYVIPDVQAQIDEFKKQGEIYKAELLEEHKMTILLFI